MVLQERIMVNKYRIKIIYHLQMKIFQLIIIIYKQVHILINFKKVNLI